MNARLQVSDAQGQRVVPIDKPLFRIGRRTESDLRVSGADVSREHAEVERGDNGGWLLRDCSSRCGTFVNDEPVTERRALKHGDQIRLGAKGESELIFLSDDSTQTTSAGAPAVAEFRHVASLLDGLRALGSARVLDDVLALVMDSAIDVTGAERGFIMLANAADELVFTIGRARGRISLSGKVFETSRKTPQKVFATGHQEILVDLSDDNLAGQHMGTLALGIRHVLCTPLSRVRYVDRPDTGSAQRPIGVLYLDSREKGRLLSPATQAALEAFATEAAAAIESARLYRESVEKARLDHDLQLAAEIQQALLPQAHQSGGHFEIVSASIPCRAIGGDFYDYFRLPGGAFGFALGDVAGKGPSAALLTAMIQGIFASQVNTAVSASSLMACVNDGLIHRSIRSRFATCVYCALAEDGRLTYCNAGHNPPILIGRNGVKLLETGGLILGMFPQAAYDQETIALDPGDVLVMYTDGVTEALNSAGEEFGEGRVRACLDANRHCPPVELLDHLLSAVRNFVGGAAQHDDVTGLVMRYSPK